MNIIAICGSPRKGNTEFVLRRFLIKAEEFGHKTDLILLREKKIGHCNSCFSCNDEGSCNMRDDMAGIVERIMADDLIVFGSPNYFNNVTGLMKDFMDRLQPLRVEDKLAGKKAVVIMVGEEGDSKSSAAIATMTSAADILKMAKVGDLYLVAKKALDVENNPESVQKIDDFAKNILS
ncbi:MAG: flavodoxin family protein [Candidatus Pacebacteria bacterium]|nr:flavodoxin family protein [Candidatus Paceibacterota bacterium]